MNHLIRNVASGMSTRLLTPNLRCPAGSLRFKSIRDEHRSGVPKEGDPLMDGTLGAESYIPVNVKGFERRLPTSETLKQKFFGIPFGELPMVFIKSTRNNTLVHVVDHKYKSITYTSCRLEGFKNARKKTTIAGQTTGVAAGQRLLRRGINAVRVLIKGIGPGRMSSVKGIASTGVNIVSLTDRTLLPELGPRPRKIRRV